MDPTTIDLAHQVATNLSEAGIAQRVIEIIVLILLMHGKTIWRWARGRNGTSSVHGSIDHLTQKIDLVASDIADIKTKLAVDLVKINGLEDDVKRIELNCRAFHREG